MAIGAGAILGSAAISAAGSGISSAGGAAATQGGQRRARKFTREVMQNQRQWMADDLRKAGINPMLASGASPTGHASGAPAVHMNDPKIDLIGKMQSAQAINNMKSSGRSLEAQANADESNSALNVDINNELRKPENIGAYVRSQILGTGSTATIANVISSIAEAITGKNKTQQLGEEPPKETPKTKSTQRGRNARGNWERNKSK